MYCENCGTKLDDDAVFCPKCGHNVIADENEQQPQAEEKGTVSQASAGRAVTKTAVNKKALIIVAAIVAVLIAGAVVFAIVSHHLYAEKYINNNVEFSGGYNYSGSISNKDVFDVEKLSDDLGYSQHSSFPLTDYFTDINSNDKDSIVHITFNKNSGLKNGDVVTAKIKVNYDKINSYGFKKKLVGKKEYTKKYTVSGLEEPTAIDPFVVIKDVVYDSEEEKTLIEFNKDYNEDIGQYNIEYYSFNSILGESEGAKLSLDSEDDEDSEIYIPLKINDDASSKESAVVEASKSNGYPEIVCTQKSKVYTPQVAKLLMNINDFKSLNDYNALKNESNEQIQMNHEDDSVKFEGSYFVTDDDSNTIFFLYKCLNENELYYSYRFDDVKIKTDGSIADLDSAIESSEENFNTEYNSVKEFTSSYKDEYTIVKFAIKN